MGQVLRCRARRKRMYVITTKRITSGEELKAERVDDLLIPPPRLITALALPVCPDGAVNRH